MIYDHLAGKVGARIDACTDRNTEYTQGGKNVGRERRHRSRHSGGTVANDRPRRWAKQLSARPLPLPCNGCAGSALTPTRSSIHAAEPHAAVFACPLRRRPRVHPGAAVCVLITVSAADACRALQLPLCGGFLNSIWNVPGNPRAPAWWRAVEGEDGKRQ